MNFLALLLGLALERALTHLFHWREFRWLDPVFAWHQRAGSRVPSGVRMLASLALVLALVAPVAIGAGLLWNELLQIPYFAFAVGVLFFSLGPHDLGDEVDDYSDAVSSGDEAAQRLAASFLLEQPPESVSTPCHDEVERTIYVQAGNRVFGVVFWFLLLGPTGAWAFRVLDLLRRRTANGDAAALRLHAVAAWLPARLLGLAYLLAGNFEEALAAWRQPQSAPDLAGGNRELLARVGIAAAGRSGLSVEEPTTARARIGAARALVIRSLWMIWCPVIAVLTLYGWLV
jgi:membrane protein required for beta-lactamase induction